MELTQEVKNRIDGMTYQEMLSKWRFAPSGDSIFQGDSGKYFSEVMNRKREEVGPAEHTAASKAIGWD